MPKPVNSADQPWPSSDRVMIEGAETLSDNWGRLTRYTIAYRRSDGVTERLHLFVGEYTAADRVSAGGGHASEGEDIEVIEVTLDQALAMIERREIVDAKTILLVYHAKLKALI